MQHSQPEQAFGQTGTPTPGPGPQAPAGQPDQPTLIEFLTRLVGNPQARSAFEANPRASLEGAGFGDMTAADVLHGASLVLDYAPAEVVQEYGRSVQSSIEMFAASTQQVAINQLHQAQEHEHQEATEPNMLSNSSSQADYSAEGDTDAQISHEQSQDQGQRQETDVNVSHETSYEHYDQDSHNLISVHDVANGNIIGSAVGNTVSVAGDTVNNTVTSVTETVNNTVDNSLNAVGNVTANVGVENVTGLVGDVTGVAGNVTNSLSLSSESEADSRLLNVEGTVDSVAGGLPVVGGAVDTVQDVAGGATAGLPLDLL